MIKNWLVLLVGIVYVGAGIIQLIKGEQKAIALAYFGYAFSSFAMAVVK